jgi:glycerol-3-phosphate dehydrogenase
MSESSVVFMYVGNLETYQGIDLLLESFALHHRARPSDRLVIIGGVPGDVIRYRVMADRLNLGAAVDFRGHQPVSRMAEFFAEADVLVSPRIKGTNTPMKIYSYLDAEKPVLATNLFTHTQVLTPDVAVLADPKPAAFAEGFRLLSDSPETRHTMAAKGKLLMSTTYSIGAFKQSVSDMYSYVEHAIGADATAGASARFTGTYDLVVMGGGIHGACVASFAARQGWKVALIEAEDFGGAASANSLKVMHGGLRYLQHLDMRRMNESIAARSLMMQLAPDLVFPRGFVMPLKRFGLRSPPVLALALAANEWISRARNERLDPAHRIPPARLMSQTELTGIFPAMTLPNHAGAALWYDAVAEDTERLTLAFVLDAERHGATVANYTKAIGLIREGGVVRGVEVFDADGKQTEFIRCRHAVWAGGASWPSLLGRPLPADHLPNQWVRATNLVLRVPWPSPLGLAVTTSGTAGRRALFFVPWRDRVMAGTWYSPCSGASAECSVSEAEIEQWLSDMQPLWPDLPLHRGLVDLVHSGVLPAGSGANPSRRVVIAKGTKHGLPEGFTLLQGVKYTTAPLVALRAVRAIGKSLGLAQPHAAWNKPLVDAVVPPSDISEDVIRHAVRHEHARTLSDLLLRRIGLGSRHMPDETELRKAASIMGEVCGWDQARREREIECLREHFRSLGLPA